MAQFEIKKFYPKKEQVFSYLPSGKHNNIRFSGVPVFSKARSEVKDGSEKEVTPKFRACDGVVVGSPVYFASANGTLISFLDRLFAGSAFYDLSMKVVSSQYWNQVHGHSAEDVQKDEEGACRSCEPWAIG